MKIKITFLFLITCFTLSLHAQNILISGVNTPNEPSIKLDPKHPEIIVAASNLNNYFLSSDTGRTWTLHNLSSSYGVWGDPVIDVDTSGVFYFTHLSNPPVGTGNWIDRIVCQKSLDSGQTWNNGSFVGLNGTKAQDKQWTVVDRNNNNIYMTWTQFDTYGSALPSDSSIILFSKSTDGGDTWSTPLRINKVAGDCLDDDETVEGATPAVGPNGEVYVAWAGPAGLVFNKSTDQGTTWLKQDVFIDSMIGGWSYNIPGIFRANGLPVTKCDLSGGPNHGTIYVNWSSQGTDTTSTDVWLSKSTDGGNTWSKAIRVNDNNTNTHQFFTWMDIDQTNGNLYFVFYDRRNYTDTQTDVYLAFSKDGGQNFVNRKISDTPFVPNEGVFFGDYINITVHNNIVRPIWIRLHNGQLSAWTNITPFDELMLSQKELPIAVNNQLKIYPNPTNELSYVSFKLHGTSQVSINLYNQAGAVVFTVVDDEKMDYGKFIIPINIAELNLPEGVYYVKISINNSLKTLKTIVID